MSWLNAISIANRETRQVEADNRKRETEIRNLQRMRQQDYDAEQERARQAAGKAAAQSDVPDFVGLPTGSMWGQVPTPPAAPPTPQSPGPAPSADAQRKRQQVQPSERAAVRSYNTQRYPDQTSAESARLARQANPAGANEAMTDTMMRRTNEWKARRRLEEANPPQDLSPDVSVGRTHTAAGAPAPAAGATFEAFKAAIYGQESLGGKMDTSKPNYAGALGKGQIIEATFNGLKRQGKIPAHFEWRNPAHNEAAAEVYMKEAWDAAGGDPAKAAAYYYAGPKGIAGGQINTYRDLRNDKAPDTHQYAQQVLARMGLAPASAPATTPGLPVASAAPAADAQVASAPAPTAQAAPAAVPADVVGGTTQNDTQALRVLQMQHAELRRRLPYARTVEEADAIRDKLATIVAGAQEIQVRNTAMRAMNDDQALTSLAAAAGTPFAATQQGFVLVQPDGQGNWRPASQPVDRMSLITHVMGILTGSLAAQAAEARKSQQKINESVAVEQTKGLNKLRELAAQSQLDMQKELMKYQLTEGDIKGVEFNPVNGQPIVRTTRGIFEVVPGTEVDGMKGPSTLRPVR